MKNREKGHQTQFTYRFILKFFFKQVNVSLLLFLFLTIILCKSETKAQSLPSVTLLNDVVVGTSQDSWIQWSPRLRTSYQTSILSLDLRTEFSVAGYYSLYENSDFQPVKRSSFRERVSLKEISLQKSWDSIDLKAGYVNLQWGLSANGPVSQFFGRADLSSFTMTDEEDVPLGQYAILSRFYTGSDRWELILSPLPSPAPLPDRNSRWNFISDLEQATIEWIPQRPEWSLHEVQFAFRYLLSTSNTWQAEWIGGRWAGSLPVFGFDVQIPYQTQQVSRSSIMSEAMHTNISDTQPAVDRETDTPPTPLLTFTLQEEYSPKWVSAISFEFLPDSKWIIRTDHLIRFNQKRIELPFSRSVALSALTDPLLGQAVIPQLIGDSESHLAEGIMSQHYLSVERSVGTWNLNSSLLSTFYAKVNEKTLRKPWRNSILFSGRRTAFRDRLIMDIHSQWNLGPFDFRIHPSATWQSQDLWSFTAGVQLFGGEAPEPLFTDLSYYTFRNSGYAYLRFILFAL